MLLALPFPSVPSRLAGFLVFAQGGCRYRGLRRAAELGRHRAQFLDDFEFAGKRQGMEFTMLLETTALPG